MPHNIVYGICEDKCQVQVLSKQEVYNLITSLQTQIGDLIEQQAVLENQIRSLQTQINNLK